MRENDDAAEMFMDELRKSREDDDAIGVWSLPKTRPCPSCGHCPTCGRGGTPCYPYYPVSPTPPYGPVITWTTGYPTTVKTYC